MAQKTIPFIYDDADPSGAFTRLSALAATLAEEFTATVAPDLPDVSIPEVTSELLAWGAKVSDVFRDRVRWIASDLKMDANFIMACIAWESGETFSASITNKAGSGATGLIQFMPTTAIELGTTVAKLAAMKPEDQLNFVYKYFALQIKRHGRLVTLEDVYMSILWPSAIGKPASYVLFDRAKQPTAFRQNAGLDTDKNGQVTKYEAAAKVRDKLTKGLERAA